MKQSIAELKITHMKNLRAQMLDRLIICDPFQTERIAAIRAKLAEVEATLSILENEAKESREIVP